jgi:hypothetical protein
LSWIKRQPSSDDLFQGLVEVNFNPLQWRWKVTGQSEGTQDALEDILAHALDFLSRLPSPGRVPNLFLLTDVRVAGSPFPFS